MAEIYIRTFKEKLLVSVELAPSPELETVRTADMTLGLPSPILCLDEIGRGCHRCDAPARRDQSAAPAATSPAYKQVLQQLRSVVELMSRYGSDLFKLTIMVAQNAQATINLSLEMISSG